MLLRFVILVAALAMAAVVSLAAPGKGAGQAHKSALYRYTLIDLGTLGGPQAAIANSPPRSFTGNVAVVGVADTALSDPYGPNDNPGFNGDAYVQHTFIWHNGVIADLGALGPLPGHNSSVPNDVNAQGDAAGASDNGTIDPLLGSAENDAVLWEDGKIINLGTLGGNESGAFGLNNRDQVVGFAANTTADPLSMLGVGTQTRAFLWQDGLMRDLGTLGGPDAVAFVVNNRGQVAGNAYTNSTPSPVTGSPTTDPFLWEDGHMRDLGTLGGTQGGVNAMNNRGEVVGQSNLAGDLTFHPFLSRQGSLIDLGTFGGDLGSANSLNEGGQVIGWANTPEKLPPPLGEPGDQVYHAFLWQHGVMTDLGATKGDRCSVAYAVNVRSQVVGGSGICHGAIDAFLWEKGSMLNLNSLIAPSDLHLRLAFSINDKGEIVGYGALPNGNRHEFLLIPNEGNDNNSNDNSNGN